MSILSRLFGKSPPPAPEPAASQAHVPAESPPRPDAAARAREEEASLSQAIAAGDAGAVGHWVLHGSSTRIRQGAAQAITDPEQLRELIRATRGGKDKSVYRILTGKRDELLATERNARQLQAEIDAAAAAIERLAARPYDGSYPAVLVQLETRWQAVAVSATADLQREVAQQLDRARAVIDAQRQAAEAEAARQLAAAAVAEESARQRELQAQAAAAAATANAAEQARHEQAEREAERARSTADDAAVRDLLGMLRQAQAALDHGGSARATRLRDAIAARLPDAPTLPPWYERKLQELDARLAELKDWKTFTVEPKRGELLQRMQGLIGADMSAEELARQIRRLRDEWRTLHRGVGTEVTEEQKQSDLAFEEAAERAYEPCRVHFAQQAEQRRENQARREDLIERLSRFAAEQLGEQPNWPAVQQALIESRREWRLYAPVDQDVIKPLQQRFHAVLDELQSRLDAEYAANVQVKRDLIARAAELTALADTRQAIDAAKALQRNWKSSGPVPRHLHNAMWDEFRHHCDAVFERSSQESAAYGAALETNQARAIGLCTELEAMGDATAEQLLEQPQRLDGLRAEFEALELPRASVRELRQRFGQALDRCRDVLRRQHEAAARQAWTNLLSASAQVRAYALAVVQQRPADQRAALRAAAESSIAGLAHAPKGTSELLREQLAGIDAGTVRDDLAVHESALRMLCVRAELLAELPTPDEDLELRREYQMQLLVASMGRGERPAPTQLDDLVLEWLAVGPVETTLHDALLARFERCRGAGLPRRPDRQ
jgi:hypothetical protein